MPRLARIRQLLETAFTPDYLEVADESAAHAGHEAAQPGGQTHYHVVIAAPALAGLSRVAAHRRVNQVLAPEFAGGLHALRIKIKAP